MNEIKRVTTDSPSSVTVNVGEDILAATKTMMGESQYRLNVAEMSEKEMEKIVEEDDSELTPEEDLALTMGATRRAMTKKAKVPKSKSAKATKVTVPVVKHGFAKLPEYATPGSAGCDVFANTTMPIWIRPGEIKLIPTGLRVKIPEGYCIKLYSRSGLALKKGVALVNGTGIIDNDYRDEIGVALINHGDQNLEIKKHDRIAQMILEKVEQIDWSEITSKGWESDEELTRSGGFGSTGK